MITKPRKAVARGLYVVVAGVLLGGCLGTQFADSSATVPLRPTETSMLASLERVRHEHGAAPLTLVPALQERTRFWSDEAAAGRKNLATAASLAASDIVEAGGRPVQAYITTCDRPDTMTFPRDLVEETPLTAAVAASPDHRPGAPEGGWIVLLVRPDPGPAALRSEAGGSTPGNVLSPAEMSRFAISRKPCGADWPRINTRFSSRF